MLTRPSWIQVGDQRIRFAWDEERSVRDLSADAAPVLRAAMKMSMRARLVLCMGLYEWVVWRFEGMHARQEPLQIVEAGWCAAVDPNYLRFFDLTREDWRGAVEGPLFCASTWLQPAMSRGDRFPKDLYDTLSLLYRLALHVLPDGEGFGAWLGLILERLPERHPLMPDDPFADPLDHDIGRRLGPLIGRDALDPREGEATRGVDVVDALDQMLQGAKDSGNPFLRSPAELKEAGFRGSPYVAPRR
jgi:hypothetical protein